MGLGGRPCLSHVVLMARLTRRALSLDFLAPAFPGELVRVLFRERVGGNRSGLSRHANSSVVHASVDRALRPNRWLLGSNCFLLVVF